MKGILKFLACSALLAASLPAFALPHIKWVDMTHQFGAFSEDLGVVKHVFKGVNTGDETLVIYDVRPNCGCVVTKRYSGMEYAPGDTISIDVEYHAEGRPGRFSKKIQVQSNADPNKQTLIIGGTVIGADRTVKNRYPVEAGPMRMHTSTSVLGNIVKGRSGGAYVKCYNSSSDTIRPAVIEKPEYLSAIVEPAIVPPGEMFVVSLNMFSSRCPQWGLVSDSIVIQPDSRSPFTVTNRVTATITENFKNMTEKQLAAAPVVGIEPATIDLGRIAPGSAPQERTITISNTGKSDLILRRVWTPDSSVTIGKHPTRVKAGKKETIKVTIDPSAAGNDLLINARITIIANDPVSPTNIVRVTAEFQK